MCMCSIEEFCHFFFSMPDNDKLHAIVKEALDGVQASIHPSYDRIRESLYVRFRESYRV